MERFLRYSMDHDRPIRAVFLREGVLMQKKVTVLGLGNGQVTLWIGPQQQQTFTLPVSDVLSCDYARGDHGEE